MDRWFSNTSSNALSIDPVNFTGREKQTMAEITEFAKSSGNSNRELMHCLDAHGLVLHDQSMGLKSAPLTDLMKDAMRTGLGVRLWHNHPSQDSLSSHDWNCAGACPEVEILAVNASGSIFVGRMPEWRDENEALIKTLSRIAGDAQFKISGMAREKQIDIGIQIALEKLTGHIVNLGMRNAGVVCYACQFSDGDQATVDAISHNGIMNAAVTYAYNEIQAVLHAPTSRPDQSSVP